MPTNKVSTAKSEGPLRLLRLFREAVSNLLNGKRAGRHDRRTGKNFDQHIDSLVKALESAKDPRMKQAMQAQLDHVRDRMGKFEKRRKSDRRAPR